MRGRQRSERNESVLNSRSGFWLPGAEPVIAATAFCEDTHMRKLLILTLLTALLGGVAACNTVEGLGKDLKSLGDAMSNKAEEKKDY